MNVAGRRGQRGRASTVFLVLLALGLGLAGGMAIQDRRAARPAAAPAASTAHVDHAPDHAASEEDVQLWTCGMHPQVVQDHPGECPICHMDLVPMKKDKAGGGATASGDREVKYWWDPMMNPPYISRSPGKSPMGMDLLPVYADEVSGGATVVIDPVVTQNMGLRTTKVREGVVSRDIRVSGIVKEAEPGVRDINLRVSGWVQKLYADTEGMHVQQGDPLFDLYSPDLQVAIEELIAMRRRAGALKQAETALGVGERAGSLAGDLRTAAVRKLELLGISRDEIDRLSRLESAPPVITFRSPITGHVTEKAVVAGAAVEAGQRAMRIVDHTVLWIEAKVFEQQLASIEMGQKMVAGVVAQPGKSYVGEVIFIHPHLDEMTRTAMVRMEVANPALELRPGMFAHVDLHTMVAERGMLIPREAVIDTGTRQVVFVMGEANHFEPREVALGTPAEDGMVQIRRGLAPGETVVVSGQFLLDAESRLQEALRKYLDDRRSAGAATGASAGASAGASK